MVKRQVLLLGGIGSGKSTVARLLAERGADTVDADQIGHLVLEDLEVKREIAMSWPSVVDSGGIDRSLLAAVVFSDERSLAQLEKIMHPRIKELIASRVEGSDDDVVIVEMPILRDLVNGRWTRVVVDAPDCVRVARLEARGMSKRDIQARMLSQPAREEYLGMADYVISNGGSNSALESEVDRLGEILGLPEESDPPLPPNGDALDRESSE